jgi:hypothetical protein
LSKAAPRGIGLSPRSLKKLGWLAVCAATAPGFAAGALPFGVVRTDVRGWPFTRITV